MWLGALDESKAASHFCVWCRQRCLVSEVNKMKKANMLFSTKEIAMLALSTAAAVVGRLVFQFIPNIQPMTDILLLLSIYQGLKPGLIVSTLAVVITSLYLGTGLWTISQLISFTILVIIAFFLSKIPIFKRSVILQMIFAFAAGFLYGFIISIFESKFYGIQSFLPYYLAGVSFDTMHAVGNAGFYILLYPFFSRKNLLKS